MTRMSLRGVGLLGVLVAGCCTSGVLYMTEGGPGVSAQAGELIIPITEQVPQQYTASMEPYGIRFVDLATTAGKVALLPGGSAGLSAQQAVSHVLQSGITPALVDGQLPTGVSVAARYGLYFNEHFARRLADGTMKPVYENRPAWLVTIFGPGLAVPSFGPPPISTNGAHTNDASAAPVPTPMSYSEQNVIVDASTGIILGAYT